MVVGVFVCATGQWFVNVSFFSQAIYQHLDLQQNVFAVSLALEDLNQDSVAEPKAAKSGSGSDDARNSSAR